jgi:phosphopantetheinyl transferase (holo-ACP synthase)
VNYVVMLYCSGISDMDILKRFYVNWALKETVVKAIGCGIGQFPLDKVGGARRS